MYERSAIVLERYFENLLGYREKCSIRDNFTNYCRLVEKLEKYQINFKKEAEATSEFRASISKIKSIQAAQESLYQKSAELEYNRHLLFGNIEGKVEDTRKCIEKIEADVEENNEKMKQTKEELIEALNEYNEKRFELSKCKRYKKMAENDYNEILEKSQTNYEGIANDTIKDVKAFSGFDDIDDVVNTLDENGKDEKIPFNEGVMQNATTFDVELAKREASGYLVIYDKMGKLLTDIKAGTAKIDLHKKYLRNEKAKMDFIMSAKEYVTQFLDYERMTVIYGRKSHNRLMSEACESFSLDIVQINNLYELLLMEIANKATKKAYKSLYNKSYLIDIQDKEEKFKKEKSRVNLNTATLINSNFWRIDSIKAIYTVFYKNVIEVFGREVEEFDLPKDSLDDADDQDDSVEDAIFSINDEEEKSVVVSIPFDINSDNKASTDEDDEDFSSDSSDSYNAFNEIIDNVVDDLQEGNPEDFDIFGEKYKENDFLENIALQEEVAAKKAQIEKKASKTKKKAAAIEIKEEEDITEDIIFEKDEEEALFSEDIKPVQRKKSSKNKIEDIDITSEDVSSPKILKKIKKVSGINKKKKAESDVW